MIRNIQALRAVAAFMVVLHHVAPLVVPLGLDPGVLRFGALGVDVFFVISGFVMFHTASRKPQTPVAFIGHRILRVVPLYWLLTLATFAVALASPGLMGGTRPDPAHLAKSLFFVPYLREDQTMRPILFVGWSLNFEMMFYLIFAVGILFRDLRARLVFVIAVLALMMVAHFALGGRLPPPLLFLTGPIILEFGAGMVLARLLPRIGSGPLARLAGPGIILGFVALAASAWIDLPVALPWGAPAAVLIVACALALERNKRVIRSDTAMLLGDASYALYLVHPFVAQALIKLATRLYLVNAWSAVPLIVLALAVSGVAAIAVHLAIEKPLTRILRRRDRPVAGPAHVPEPAPSH